MIYQFYYPGGDTIAYYNHSLIINESFSESPVKWFNLVFRIPSEFSGEYSDYISRLFWYYAPNNYMPATIGAIFGIITFNTYLNSSLLFAVLAFTGNWAMFRCFATQYQSHSKAIAIATLFIPSVFFWGSGFNKDSICMFGLGWITKIFFDFFLEGKIRLGSIVLLALAFYLVFVVKVYIIVAIIPALAFWITSKYSHRLGNPYLGNALRLAIIGGLVILIPYISSKFAEELGSYSLENIVNTSASLQYNMNRAAIADESSSAYSLGQVDPTIGGMLRTFPAAVNVTLFRPYLWEVKKPIVLISALESLILFVMCIRIVFSMGIRGVFRSMTKDVTIQFLLIYTIIFAFAIGISTLNFGTLSRYKVPCMPTFMLALLSIYYSDSNTTKKLFPFIKGFI